jgi:hypothetical protein
MEPPATFNELFAEAARGGFRLDLLEQDSAGFFKCRWRHGDRVFREVERRLPFNAALDAFLLAREGSAPPEAGFDLFG